jgi:phage terminase large subunit GpA-like protein
MRERNEALDCRVYARAAASRIGIERFQEKHWADFERRVAAPPVRDGAKPPAPRTQAPRSQVRFKVEI